MSIPLEITFEPAFAERLSYIICNSFIDILFTLDIIITFRTTFVSSKTGYEVFDSKEIAKNYLFGRFWIDFFTIFPFNYISVLKKLKAIAILKVTRIFRLDNMINKLNAEEEFKQTLNLLKLIMNLLLFVHLTG